jgi:hypothetical protein
VAAPEEFLDFLKLIARTYPRRPLHVIVDNASTYKTPEVQAWRPAPPHLRRSQGVGARSPWAWASPRMVENDVVETTALSVLVDSPLRWLAIVLATLYALVYIADRATSVVRVNVDWWQTRSRRWRNRRSRGPSPSGARSAEPDGLGASGSRELAPGPP